MKGKDLLKLMSEADVSLIEESENAPQVEKKKISKMAWLLPLAGVVAIVLLIGVGVLFQNGKKQTSMSSEEKRHEDLGYCIYLDNIAGVEFHSADAEDKIRYGLPSDGSDIILSQSDIGEYIGTVSDDRGQELVGKKAYHYAKYPKYNSIIIVELEDSYALFCAYGYSVDVPLGDSLKDAFTKYGLPEKGVKIEVYDHNEELIRTITERSDIEQIVEILVSCNNIGYTEPNRRLVQAWNETYGNDYVYLDEKSGTIKYRDIIIDQTIQESITNSSFGGVETKSEGERLPVEDMAHELWNKDSLELIIEVSEGYRIRLNYCPLARKISAFNGAFDLTEEKMKKLDALVK